MSEEPLRVCPVCGAAAERLLSPGAGLVFKGSGFYITDYRSDSYKKAAAADTGKASEGKAGDVGSSGPAPEKSGGSSTDGGSSKPKPSGGSDGGTQSGGGSKSDPRAG